MLTSSIIIIPEQIKARCSDDTTDVTDSPSRPPIGVRGPPLSSHQLQNTHPGTIFALQV